MHSARISSEVQIKSEKLTSILDAQSPKVYHFWTPEENETLLRLVSQSLSGNWNEIAAALNLEVPRMKLKTVAAIRSHYADLIKRKGSNDEVKHIGWTESEDETLKRILETNSEWRTNPRKFMKDIEKEFKNAFPGSNRTCLAILNHIDYIGIGNKCKKSKNNVETKRKRETNQYSAKRRRIAESEKIIEEIFQNDEKMEKSFENYEKNEEEDEEEEIIINDLRKPPKISSIFEFEPPKPEILIFKSKEIWEIDDTQININS